jgi:hypothetical protein
LAAVAADPLLLLWLEPHPATATMLAAHRKAPIRLTVNFLTRFLRPF